MDHTEAREALELAALEVGGLDRLMAGDTARAAAVAGHLAGCDACATELERLRRAVPMLREVVRTTPAPDLRARTLASVRERGEPRGAPVGVMDAGATATRATDAVTDGTPMGGPDVVPDGTETAPDDAMRPDPSPVATPTRRGVLPGRGRPALPWVAAIAAAIVLSVVATNLLLGGRFQQQDRAIAGLEAVTAATLTITGEPGATRVALRGAGDPAASGSLLFSPSTTQLVVVATGLERPPDGREFRCWVEIGGERQVVGRMFFADDLAYWVGDTPAVGALPGGADVSFGVSLVDVAAPTLEADPVIVGQL